MSGVSEAELREDNPCLAEFRKSTFTSKLLPEQNCGSGIRHDITQSRVAELREDIPLNSVTAEAKLGETFASEQNCGSGILPRHYTQS